jgi:hypothetical protein
MATFLLLLMGFYRLAYINVTTEPWSLVCLGVFLLCLSLVAFKKARN